MNGTTFVKWALKRTLSQLLEKQFDNLLQLCVYTHIYTQYTCINTHKLILNYLFCCEVKTNKKNPYITMNASVVDTSIYACQ